MMCLNEKYVCYLLFEYMNGIRQNVKYQSHITLSVRVHTSMRKIHVRIVGTVVISLPLYKTKHGWI